MMPSLVISVPATSGPSDDSNQARGRSWGEGTIICEDDQGGHILHLGENKPREGGEAGAVTAGLPCGIG
jgi:hypothetical protein